MSSSPDHASAESAEHSPPLYDDEDARARARPVLIRAMAMLFYQGYISAILPIASPWIAKSFGLDQSAIAGVFAWLALAYLGALALSRMADKAGRRRVMLWSMTAMPICALGAALSSQLATFVLFAILLNAFGGAVVASAIVIVAEVLPIARRAQGQSYAGLAVVSGGGLRVVIMPILDHYAISWRWLLWIAAICIAIGPFLAFSLPESVRWENAAKAGETVRARFYDLFVPLYRKRSIALTGCTILGTLCSRRDHDLGILSRRFSGRTLRDRRQRHDDSWWRPRNDRISARCVVIGKIRPGADRSRHGHRGCRRCRAVLLGSADRVCIAGSLRYALRLCLLNVVSNMVTVADQRVLH